MRFSRAGIVLVAVAMLLLATPAGAQDPDDGDDADITVRLTSQTPWLAGGGTFDLHLVVRNETNTSRLRLVVTVHRPVSSRSEFARTLDGEVRRSVKQLVVPLAEVPLDTGGDRVVSMPLPRADAPPTPATLPPLTQGVYPVSVALQDGEGTVVDRFVTHLVRLPDGPTPQPLSVAWIQTVGARPAIRADGDPALADVDAVPVAVASTAAGTYTDLPMTLDITPETIAALDANQLFALRVAVGGRHQLLASPFVDVDASALVAAGQADDLATQRQLGDELLFELLGDRGDPRVWSADHPLTPAALRRLRELGVTQVVVPESSLAPLPTAVTGGLTVARPFHLATSDGDELDAVGVDAGITAHFRNGASQVLAAHQLLADLAVLFFDAPGAGRGVAVRAPSTWRSNQAFLDVVLRALTASPILRPVTLNQLFDDVAPLQTRAGPVLRSLATTTRATSLPAARLRAAHRAVDGLTSLVGAGNPPIVDVRRRLLAGESSRLSSATRRTLLDSVPAALHDVRSRLDMPDGQTFRLTARDGTIFLTIHNRNPFPVRVQLVLASDKLEFRDVDGPDRGRLILRDLELRPGTQTRAVPLRVRASATFSLRATLLAPDGDEILRARYTIASTVFSGVGIVLSIGAGLFLLLWWASHWRTVRRDRRLVEPARRGGH